MPAPGLQKGQQRPPQQFIAQAAPLQTGYHTDLRDVPHPRRQHAGQGYPARPARPDIHRHVGSGLEEEAASGVLHDVGQEAAGAGGGAVLIVDLGINVPSVGGLDDLRGFLVPARAPILNQGFAGGASGLQPRNAGGVQYHELAWVDGEKLCAGQAGALTHA